MQAWKSSCQLSLQVYASIWISKNQLLQVKLSLKSGQIKLIINRRINLILTSTKYWQHQDSDEPTDTSKTQMNTLHAIYGDDALSSRAVALCGNPVHPEQPTRTSFWLIAWTIEWWWSRNSPPSIKCPKSPLIAKLPQQFQRDRTEWGTEGASYFFFSGNS